MSSKQADSKRHALVARNCCVGVVFQRTTDVTGRPSEDGHRMFSDFLQQNSLCFWNACLTRSVASLEYVGCLVPGTVLISGTEFALEVVRSAWARRVLRPPKGYTISKLGDIGAVEIFPVSQTQFAPLSEAVCVAVAELNSVSLNATTSTVRRRLETDFPDLRVPSEDILYRTLGQLIRERKLYHTGNGYFVVSPDTYRQRSMSPLCERQMLMTNEEAIVRLHGGECSSAVQVDETDIAAACSFLQARRDVSCQITQVPPSPDLHYLERSHSLKILRAKARPKTSEGRRGASFKETSTTKRRLGYIASENINDLHKTEKQSMLAKILKRMQSLTEKSNKHVAFSAQFPPLEWLDTAKLHRHSVATQTFQKVGPTSSLNRLETATAKIPWEDMERGMTVDFSRLPKTALDDSETHNGRRNASVLMRQGGSRQAPTHRYSHGPFTNHAKRRHRHRRSSSESPKVHKADCHTPSTGSKSPTDRSDAKISLSSSSGGCTLTINPKAIVNPCPRKQDPSPSKFKPILLNNTLTFKGNGTVPGVVEPRTIKDLITYSPKLSKQGYHQEQRLGEPRTVKDFTMCSTKVPKSLQNTTNVTLIPDTRKEDNQSENKQSRLGHQEVVSEFANKQKHLINRNVEDSSFSAILSDAKLALSESFSDTSVSCNGLVPTDKNLEIKPHASKSGLAPTHKVLGIKPLVLKNFVDSPKPQQLNLEKKNSPKKEIVIDNSVSVEVAVDKSPSPTKKKGNNISTTVVTEETTVTKGNGNSKVVTVTSITTSLSQGGIKDLVKPGPDKEALEDVSSVMGKSSVNDLNIDTGKGSRVIDCSSSCNIVTEVK